MTTICPAILAITKTQYDEEMQKVAGFAHRIQIDLTDGDFTRAQTIQPEEAWWPVGVSADIHLMYKQPMIAAKKLVEHKPNLMIAHAEASGSFKEFAALCREHKIKVGVALLPETAAQQIFPGLDVIDHVLIFSGSLGEYGGHANLGLLEKARILKAQKPELEIGWDGGVNDQNVAQLVFGGIDVLNVGGFIQKSDDPEHTYKVLERIAAETGTT